MPLRASLFWGLVVTGREWLDLRDDFLGIRAHLGLRVGVQSVHYSGPCTLCWIR